MHRKENEYAAVAAAAAKSILYHENKIEFSGNTWTSKYPPSGKESKGSDLKRKSSKSI